MIYTFLISVVFVAEIIIAITILQNLLRLDKAVVELDETITSMKPTIADIGSLSKKISEQLVDLSMDFVDKIKKEQEEIVLRYLSKILLTLVIIKMNFKMVNRFRKSEFAKIVGKGLSLLENMV